MVQYYAAGAKKQKHEISVAAVYRFSPETPEEHTPCSSQEGSLTREAF